MLVFVDVPCAVHIEKALTVPVEADSTAAVHWSLMIFLFLPALVGVQTCTVLSHSAHAFPCKP